MSKSGLSASSKASERNTIPPRTGFANISEDTALGKLLPQKPNSWWVALETVLVPLLCVGIGMFLNHQNPLWIGTPFPWAWLGPLIVALRYGSIAGLGAGLLLGIAWWAIGKPGVDTFPEVYFLGGLILTLLSGEFADVLRQRTRRAESVQFYLEQRLEHLVREFYLLRLSHDRLEQELIVRPMSMRDALAVLHSPGNAPAQAQQLLQLLSQYCHITAASLFPVTNGQPQPQPLASIGAIKELQANDELIQHTLETRHLSHVGVPSEERASSTYLVAAPLVDPSGETFALLLIEDMPFFSLQEENLQTLGLLLGYYSDGLARKALSSALMRAFPLLPAHFAFELQRLHRLQQHTQVTSSLMVVEFSTSAVERGLVQQLLRFKRLLDTTWHLEGTRAQVVTFLMPLGDTAAVEGFIARLETWIFAKEARNLNEAGIYTYPLFLDGTQTPQRIVLHVQGLAHG